MSRKKRAPKRIAIVDPKYKSAIIPKLINSIMFDGKKTTAEKIVYEAIDKIKSKSKDEPINVFNEAINNIRPTVEVRSRRVGGSSRGKTKKITGTSFKMVDRCIKKKKR